MGWLPVLGVVGLAQVESADVMTALAAAARTAAAAALGILGLVPSTDAAAAAAAAATATVRGRCAAGGFRVTPCEDDRSSHAPCPSRSHLLVTGQPHPFSESVTSLVRFGRVFLAVSKPLPLPLERDWRETCRLPACGWQVGPFQLLSS